VQQLDKRGYMQPKIIGSRSAARNKGHVLGNVTYNTKSKRSDLQTGSFARLPAEYRQGTFGCNAYDFSQGTFRRSYSDENDYDDNYDDEIIGACQV